MNEPTLLASGRDADVFALDRRRVLRRYREGGDTAPEAAVMAYLSGAGYPVPEVHSAVGPEMVLERLDGETLLDALLAGRIDVDPAADLLVDLHDRLHALPARLSTDPTDRILHLDLHPLNVMLTSRGPVVIDWRNAIEGPADFDVAMTALIFAEVAVGELGVLADPGRLALTAFQQRAQPPRASQLRRALDLRRVNPTLTATEKAALDRAAALVRTRPD
ncbi:phosphotransferase [Micromonospora sp. NBC_01796]|uniref:phosphotransferase n=1 Tax=Micromonospora sp. NBC_01796 TaxID=2975987 RepID=UPI002DD89335|nr:phosphotransferase [Micromonospora sp. NBC_01796]WSA86806.1 phosphotransferase [Micromonospora sp. NBC_01796]